MTKPTDDIELENVVEMITNGIIRRCVYVDNMAIFILLILSP
jgi:hypothetical protein